MDRQSQPQLALGQQTRRQRRNRYSRAAGLLTPPIFGADDLADDQFGGNVIILGRNFLADARPLLTAGGTELILGLQNDLLLFQFHRRQMAARTFLGALPLVGSLLGQGFFEHLLAQGCRALSLLLSIAQQLTELRFLFLIELVGLGSEELSFQIGNDRLGFGQLLRLLLEFLLRQRQLPLELSGILQQPGRIMGQLPQNFLGRLHPWRTSRKLRRNG